MCEFEIDFAVIIPMANESEKFNEFINSLKIELDKLKNGIVYLIIDNASNDNTLDLCNSLSKLDGRFKTVWAPNNKNVVDAYLKGYKTALKEKHELIIEMDAGLSHDPKALRMFLRVLQEGNECAFGSRFINGGSINNSTYKRTLLSKFGTKLSNLLLGTRMYDITSGYQGFHRDIVEKFINYKFLSKAHFYQTELRYLMRNTRFAEIPIHYQAPSPSVSKNSISNSIKVLFHYFYLRLIRKTPSII